MSDAPAPVLVDLLVVGGGPAGLAAAATAARLGARTALVSNRPPGGDAEWDGRLPLAVLRVAAARGDGYRAACADLSRVRTEVAAARRAALDAAQVTVLRGRARFLESGRGRVVVTVEREHPAGPGRDPLARRVSAARVVVASGSRADVPSVAGLLDVAYLTPRAALDLDEVPYSLVILGGGATGCELAQVFVRFGAKVTLVERERRLLPAAEPQAGELVRSALEADGVRVLLGGSVSRVAPTLDGGAYVGTEIGGDVAATHLLVATGRRPDVRGLGLDAVAARTDAAGALATDVWLRTSAAGVFAAGGVTAAAGSSHAAQAMGASAARNALAARGLLTRHRERSHGRGAARWDPRAVPEVALTDPEVASVGLTEAQATRTLAGVRVGLADSGALDRAAVEGRSDAFVKLVTAPRRRLGHQVGGAGDAVLVGGCVVGPQACEVVGELALAIHLRTPVRELAEVVHTHLTYSGGVGAAARAVLAGAG